MRYALTYFGGFTASPMDTPAQHIEAFNDEEAAIRRAVDLMRDGGWYLVMLSMDGRVLFNPQELRLRCGSPEPILSVVQPVDNAAIRPSRPSSVHPRRAVRTADEAVYRQSAAQ
ncbi:MAG TPA: hypothetical protein VNT30_18310 [Stellaceae bacterium]|nr:hypothetical protein [Stellaceae bacterium]